MEHGARPDSKLASATVNYRGTIRFSCSTRITFFSPPRRGRGGKNRVSRPLFLPVEESVEKERGGEARRAIETEEEPFPKVGKTLRGSLAPPLFLSSPNRSSRVAQWRRKIAIFLSSFSSLFLRAIPSSILFFFFFFFPLSCSFSCSTNTNLQIGGKRQRSTTFGYLLAAIIRIKRRWNIHSGLNFQTV